MGNKKIRVVLLSPQSRNQVAKGDYIAFCDDDDLWMPDKLVKQVDVFSKNPEVNLCYTNMIRFDEQAEWISPQDNGKADFDSLLYVNTIPVSSIIVKRSSLDKYGAFTESSIVGFSEDYDFVIRHSYYAKPYHLDAFLVKYWSEIKEQQQRIIILASAIILNTLRGFWGVII